MLFVIHTRHPMCRTYQVRDIPLCVPFNNTTIGTPRELIMADSVLVTFSLSAYFDKFNADQDSNKN